MLNRLGLQWRWKVAEKQSTWFSQKPFWGGFVTLIVLYTLAGTYSPSMLIWMDVILTPLVQALRFLGLGITTPFMGGAMPKEFYVNLTGIAVWGIVIYNIASVLFLYTCKWTFPSTDESRQRALKNKPNWGPVRTWMTAVTVFFFIATYCTLCLLNGINGWFVFHMHGFFLTAAWPVFFLLLPGSLLIALWFYLSKLVVAALAAFVKFMSISFRK
ncbi:MAG: hypothetical protein JWP38_1680 [Herbaspirillum sp.]|nr:hypothetical protein [Herbaspirillum sp.]